MSEYVSRLRLLYAVYCNAIIIFKGVVPATKWMLAKSKWKDVTSPAGMILSGRGEYILTRQRIFL